MSIQKSSEERASVPMTVRSVRLPDTLWNALGEGLKQANVGRGRPIVMAELIRGLLERGLADPQGLDEVGSKVIRPSRIVPIRDTASSETGSVHAVPKVISAITPSVGLAPTVAERLYKARLSTGLKAGKVIDEICQHFDIPAEIRFTVRRQLHDATLGNTAAEPLSQTAIDAALKWLEIRNV